MTVSPKQVISCTMNEELLLDLAVGDFDDESEVFQHHGISESDAQALKENAVFQAAVVRYRNELEKDGRMTKYKARKMSDDVLSKAYMEAMGEDTPLDKRLEALKVFMKIADMEPRTSAKGTGEGGPAFAIQINLPSALPNTKPEILEIKAPED